MTNQDPQEQQAQEKVFVDQKDFFAQFLFRPDIKDAADFAHLDKNLASTRLSSRYNEPEMARALLRALHVLTKTAYYYKVREENLVGYEEQILDVFVCEKCGAKYQSEEDHIICECQAKEEKPQKSSKKVIIKREIPIFREKENTKSFYPTTFHSLKSKFYALTTTAAARDGHLMKAATTSHFAREDSIEDKTQVKSRWGSGQQQKNNKRIF